MLECGINGKMNELQAALGLCLLSLIENERAARRGLRRCIAIGLEIYSASP